MHRERPCVMWGSERTHATECNRDSQILNAVTRTALGRALELSALKSEWRWMEGKRKRYCYLRKLSARSQGPKTSSPKTSTSRRSQRLNCTQGNWQGHQMLGRMKDLGSGTPNACKSCHQERRHNQRALPDTSCQRLISYSLFLMALITFSLRAIKKREYERGSAVVLEVFTARRLPEGFVHHISFA